MQKELLRKNNMSYSKITVGKLTETFFPRSIALILYYQHSVVVRICPHWAKQNVYELNAAKCPLVSEDL
jgi:hypothetical protein